MKKTIRAVKPPILNGKASFKKQPFDAWVAMGGKTAESHYPPALLHGLAYKCDFPSLPCNRSEARLRFVEPVALTFDSFPDYIFHEVVPMIWDCWPKYFDRVVSWLKKHHVKTAIFTSSQTAERIKKVLPEMNILFVPEGIDVKPYREGNNLTQRSIDLLEYGSMMRNFFHHHIEGIKHVNRENGQGLMDSFTQLLSTMAEAKVTIALPRCDTAPEETGDIETLTQRFWEGMLSRSVLLGRAPKELVDLVGYNPVITLDREHADEQVRDIVAHISDYQSLVDKNRQTALRLASWETRMKQVMGWLGGMYNL